MDGRSVLEATEHVLADDRGPHRDAAELASAKSVTCRSGPAIPKPRGIRRRSAGGMSN
jgi:hypothetical protein